MQFRQWIIREEVALDNLDKVKRGYAKNRRQPPPPGTFGVEFEFEASEIIPVPDNDLITRDLEGSDAVREEFRKKHPRGTYNDLLDFIDKIVADGRWGEYEVKTRYSQRYKDEGRVGRKIKQYIAVLGKMGLAVKQSMNSEDTWTISEDAMGQVEIRSPILTRHDIPTVMKVSEMVRRERVTGGTSAHVHVGMPHDTDPFDLLAMVTLVDEQQIRRDEGPDRELDVFAKPAVEVYRTLYELLDDGVWDEEKMAERLKTISRKTGTNIFSWFENGTVEFRYLSSRISPEKLARWIEYYLELPNVARSRTILRVKAPQGEMTFVRRHNGAVEVRKAGRPSASNLPVADLRSTSPSPLHQLPDSRWMDRLGDIILVKRHGNRQFGSFLAGLGLRTPQMADVVADVQRGFGEKLGYDLLPNQVRSKVSTIWPKLSPPIRRLLVRYAVKNKMVPAPPVAA